VTITHPTAVKTLEKATSTLGAAAAMKVAEKRTKYAAMCAERGD